jgi:hypothetical protein
MKIRLTQPSLAGTWAELGNTLISHGNLRIYFKYKGKGGCPFFLEVFLFKVNNIWKVYIQGLVKLGRRRYVICKWKIEKLCV